MSNLKEDIKAVWEDVKTAPGGKQCVIIGAVFGLLLTGLAAVNTGAAILSLIALWIIACLSHAGKINPVLLTLSMSAIFTGMFAIGLFLIGLILVGIVQAIILLFI